MKQHLCSVFMILIACDSHGDCHGLMDTVFDPSHGVSLGRMARTTISICCLFDGMNASDDDDLCVVWKQ